MNDQPFCDDYQPVSALARAIAIWERGDLITLDLAAELMGLGYDLPALELAHRR